MTSLPPIELLIPHRAPMCFIDEMREIDESSTSCALTVRADTSLVHEGALSSLVSVEYMAQSIAAFFGFHARARGLPIRVGYLVAVRALELTVDTFEVGDELLVNAQSVFGDERAAAFACTVTRADRVVASATLSVVQNRESEEVDR